VKRILVALDGSPRAPSVLAAARRLAELTNAQLMLYRAIVASPDIPLDMTVRSNDRLEDLLVRHAHDQLSQLAEGLPRGMIEQLITELATPWDGICRTARERDVDLIVIGSHGYRGLADHLLGTVAGKVVNHADRNVLVVRTTL
jgi:nucleotide-binding universal stress UspA family protein